ncbi:MAG: hypothetical protein JXQ75_02800, partial [Phycisphaerae bacterium]|nr:hypothetical protein [Phycisphaerae bacterium]
MYAQVQWAGNGGRLSRVATLAVIASVVGSIVTRGETVAGPVEVPDRDRSGNLEWFFAPLCTGAGADATGEPIDLSNRLVLTVGGGEGCVQPGATVTVTMSQANLTIPMQGYQAYLQFDTSKLTFISGAYTPEPYGNWIFSPIHAVGSDIDLASFINIAGGQTPTQDDADLLTLTFTAGFTEGVAQIEFDTPPPNTEFIDMYGYAVPAATDDPLQVYIDGTAPVIACPPDLTVACFEDIPDPADDEESFEEQGGSIVEESPCEVSFAHEDVVIQPGDGCPDDPYVIERTYVA